MYNLARACVKSRFPRFGAPIAPVDGFLHDIRPHLTAHPPVCAKRVGTEKTGPSSFFARRFSLGFGSFVVAVQVNRIRFAVVTLLERFDPLPSHPHRHSRAVELRQVLCSVVVIALYHVRPEPPSCELPCCPVLVVEAVVVDEHPVAFLDLLRSEPVRSVEPGFVLLLATRSFSVACSTSSGLCSSCRMGAASNSSRLISSLRLIVAHEEIVRSIGMIGF